MSHPFSSSGNNEYDASQIEILASLNAIRKRPTLYIGTTSRRGVRFLIFEIISNSIDEALAGHCNNIEVFFNDDYSITVKDDGRGIPIKPFKETGKSAAEFILTNLFTGAKFGSTAYKVSRGTYGVGLMVVNALSEWLEIEIKRDGKIFYQRYRKGEPEFPPKIEDKPNGETGTKITFLPDREIFKEIIPEYEIISSYLRESSCLIKGLKIKLFDLKNKKESVFHFPNGITDYLEYLFSTRTSLFSPPIYIEGESNNIRMEATIQYFSRYYDKNIFSFANTVRTFDGGSHVEGFRSALVSSVQKYIQKHNLIDSEEKMPKRMDIEEGIGTILSVFLENPSFSGMQKSYLDNKEIAPLVEEFFSEKIFSFLENNPEISLQIAEKSKLACQVRSTVYKVEEITRKGFTNIPYPPKTIYYRPEKDKEE